MYQILSTNREDIDDLDSERDYFWNNEELIFGKFGEDEETLKLVDMYK